MKEKQLGKETTAAEMRGAIFKGGDHGWDDLIEQRV